MVSYTSYSRQCVLLKRKEGLSFDDFTSYWATTHADLVRALEAEHQPAYYTQTSPLTDGEAFLDHAANDAPVAYDGLASLDFRDEEHLKAATASQGWTVGLREDGPKFSDRAYNRFFSARSYIIVDNGYRGKTFRQIVLMRKSPDMAIEQFNDYWLNKHAPLIASLDMVKQHVLRYELLYPCDNGTLPFATATGAREFVGAAILDYRDREAYELVANSAEWKSRVATDNRVFAGPGIERVLCQACLMVM